MDKGKKLISIRLRSEEAIEYKKILIDLRKSITEDLSEHILAQREHYTLIDSRPIRPVNQREKEYAQIGFSIDAEIYLEYKKVLLDNRTNTTADLKRHILKTIEENRR